MQTSFDRVVEVSIATGPIAKIKLHPALAGHAPFYLYIDEAVTLQNDLRETLEALQHQELAR